MKKLVLTCIAIAMLLSGCSYNDSVKIHNVQDNPLILVETYGTSPISPAPRVEIYYHKDTKVMYMVVVNGSIGITPLLNSDGTPVLWED